MSEAKNMQKLVNKMFQKKDILKVNTMSLAVVMGKEGHKVMAVIVADDEALEYFNGEEIKEVSPRLGIKVDKNEEEQGIDITLTIDFKKVSYNTTLSAKNKKFQNAALEALKSGEKVGIAIVNNKKELQQPILVKWDLNETIKLQ